LVQHSDIVRYFIVTVIFYCANTTAFHESDGKFSEGGLWVKLGYKMGRRMKKIEKPLLNKPMGFITKLLEKQFKNSP